MATSIYKVLSEIFRDVGQVVFASVVVAQLVVIEVGVNWKLIEVGLAFSLLFWWLAVKMGQKGNL